NQLARLGRSLLQKGIEPRLGFFVTARQALAVHSYLSHALTRVFNALQSVNATTCSTRNERGSLRVLLKNTEQKGTAQKHGTERNSSKTRNRKEQLMWIKTSLIALGLVGTMAAATPAPTLAQGVYIGPNGVGVDIGRPGYRERRYRDYRDYNDDYAY